MTCATAEPADLEPPTSRRVTWELAPGVASLVTDMADWLGLLGFRSHVVTRVIDFALDQLSTSLVQPPTSITHPGRPATAEVRRRQHFNIAADTLDRLESEAARLGTTTDLLAEWAIADYGPSILASAAHTHVKSCISRANGAELSPLRIVSAALPGSAEGGP